MADSLRVGVPGPSTDGSGGAGGGGDGADSAPSYWRAENHTEVRRGLRLAHLASGGLAVVCRVSQLVDVDVTHARTHARTRECRKHLYLLS